MKREKTDEEKALQAVVYQLIKERAQHESLRQYAASRLCRVDDPDQVASFMDMLNSSLVALAKVDCDLDRVRNELRDLQPERIITEVASLDQIADALADRTRKPPPERTPEELAQEIKEFQHIYSDEARAERAVRRLGLLPMATRLQALVNTGLFVLEDDGRLKPIELPPPPAR